VQRRAWGGSKLAERGELTPWTVVSRDWRSWCGDRVAPAQRSIAGASCASDDSCPGFGEPGPATPLRASSQGLNATVAGTGSPTTQRRSRRAVPADLYTHPDALTGCWKASGLLHRRAL
jgi:hypothetical protein